MRSAVRATDMGVPSLRVEGRPRQADHRLPLELNSYSEELSPRAAASVMAARGEPHLLHLPVRADYLTRRHKSGSRHLPLPAPCRYAAGRRSPPQSHGCQTAPHRPQHFVLTTHFLARPLPDVAVRHRLGPWAITARAGAILGVAGGYEKSPALLVGGA